MKIEISARQAQITMLALRVEITRLSELNAPRQRKENSINELQELREYIAFTMLKNGYISHHDYNIGNY